MGLLKNIVIIGLFVMMVAMVILQVARIMKFVKYQKIRKRKLERIRERNKTRAIMQEAKLIKQDLETAMYARMVIRNAKF